MELNYTVSPYNTQEHFFNYHNKLKNKKRKVENVDKVNCEYNNKKERLGSKIDIKI